MTASPEYTAITDLDQTVMMLCKKLLGSSPTEPDARIQIAENILMLQRDRKLMVAEIMTKMYGSTKK